MEKSSKRHKTRHKIRHNCAKDWYIGQNFVIKIVSVARIAFIINYNECNANRYKINLLINYHYFD